MVGPNPPFSSGLGQGDKAGWGEVRPIWPHTQICHSCLHLSGDNNPVLGLLSGGQTQKLLRAGKDQTGNTTFPKAVSQHKDAQARREPAPGLCRHLTQLWSHHAALYPAQPLL